MLRYVIVVFAIVVTLGSSGPSNTAFARGGGYGGGGGGDGFPGNHFDGVFGVTPNAGHGGHDSRARGLGTKNAIEVARLSLPCQARGLSYKSRCYI
jgi:hypothetical protein